jgi:hypothetical protein
VTRFHRLARAELDGDDVRQIVLDRGDHR